MSYAVKEIFYTLQGEGALTGRPAVFCRFAGCNLWSGREEDRAAAVCTFCDTDFVGTDGTKGGRGRQQAARRSVEQERSATLQQLVHDPVTRGQWMAEQRLGRADPVAHHERMPAR